MPKPKTFTLDEVMRALQNAAEITSCIKPADWDGFPDRSEATLTISEASLALEMVSRESCVRWGETHDYFDATESVAEQIVAFPGVPGPADLRDMATFALSSSWTPPSEV